MKNSRAVYELARHLCESKPSTPVPCPADLLWDCAELVHENAREIGKDGIYVNPDLPHPNLLFFGHWIYWQEHP